MSSKRFNNIFRILYVGVDYLTVLGSFIAAYIVRREADVVTSLDLVEVPVLDFAFREFIKIAPLITVVWILIFLLTHHYAKIERRSGIEQLYKILQGSSLGLLALMILAFFYGRNLFSRLIIIYAWVISIFAVFLGRSILHGIQRYFWKKGTGTQKVLVCSPGRVGRQFLEGIRQQGWLGYQIVGVFSDEKTNGKNTSVQVERDEKKGPNLEYDPDRVAGFVFLGRLKDFSKFITKEKVNKVIIGVGKISDEQTEQIVDLCREQNISLGFIPDIFSLKSSFKVTETINGIPLLGSAPSPLRGLYAFLKRTFDITFSAIALLLLSPFLFMIALAVKLSSPGPIIYSQDRIGVQGNTFKCYKFRSMRHSSKHAVGWTTEDDDRRTKIGKIIRKLNVDEFPQLWNILKGDMSIVGPRPEQPEFVEQFSRQLMRYPERHKVRPGLTGWAQVNGWRGDTSIAERLQYDIFYIENWSFLFDLKIILFTLKSFFDARGAY